jgi:putative transposase
MHLTPLPGVARRQVTAVDVVSRCGVLGVRSGATAGTATDFLADLHERMPFPLRALQVDGGSEFMAEVEAACAAQQIALYAPPPRSPQLNGRVERLTGTSRREFWERYDGALELPPLQAALRARETHDHHVRPHQALGYCTPAEHLTALGTPPGADLLNEDRRLPFRPERHMMRRRGTPKPSPVNNTPITKWKEDGLQLARSSP